MPRPDEQTNLVDPDSRILRKNNQAEYRQAYNAQAAVDADGSMLLLAAPVSQCASDANELVATIDAIPATIGKPSTALADTGYANGEEPDGTIGIERRKFGAYKRDRRALAEWCAAQRPEVVVMESTGIYWKSPYAALERVGIRALVVNACHVEQVPGRKTDVSDAEWLASLARCGLLTRRSFVPPQKYREQRLVSRHRQKLTGVLSAQKNRRRAESALRRDARCWPMAESGSASRSAICTASPLAP